MSFCYWRCYNTDKNFYKSVTIYVEEAISDLNMIGKTKPGYCALEDDMFYCGSNACQACDFDF